MKILIVGSDLDAILIAKYIKTQSNRHDIYITSSEGDEEKLYTPVGIKENDISSICDFVKYNQIELTLVVSKLSIINGVADIFNKEGFPIAAPTAEAARVTFFNSIAKKVMYKLKIPTARFGIFDRENIASDYIRKINFPIVIKNDFTLSEREYNTYYSYSKAKLALQKIFETENEKIVIENYIDSQAIRVYFLTDGYNAIPLISTEKREGECFTQIKALSEKITVSMLKNILEIAIYPLLDDIAKHGENYSGIIGVNIKLQGDNFYVLEYCNGFMDYDLQIFLSLLNEDFLYFLNAAAQKRLDGLKNVELQQKSSCTYAVKKSKIHTDINDDNCFITEDDKNIIITKTAATMNLAKRQIEDCLKPVCDNETFEKIVNFNNEALRI